MDEMKVYVGTKVIKASPMDEHTFKASPMDEHTFRDEIKREHVIDDGTESRPGYKVIYPDGYVSWSPKEVFETAYREITPEEVSLLLVY